MRPLYGTHFHSLDAKGRLTIPSKLRELMPGGGTLTEGTEACLFFYPAEAWREQAARLMALDDFTPEARDAQRMQLATAAECEFDGQGRIIVPAHMRERAHITKDVAVVGVGNRIEIWDSEEWRRRKDSIGARASRIFVRASRRSTLPT